MGKGILRLPAVKSRIGLSRSHIYSEMAKGEFPQSIELGERAVGWLEEEIDAWQEEKIRRSRSAPRPQKLVGQRAQRATVPVLPRRRSNNRRTKPPPKT